MKAMRGNAFVKLLAALLCIALLTGCAYYGVFGVALTVIPTEDWTGAVLNMVMDYQTQRVVDYYELQQEYEGVKEEDIPDWEREQLAEYAALFDPETTNFRYAITDEDGNQIFGNYDGSAYLARSYDWEQRFVGTELDRQKLNAFEDGVLYDYETDEYLLPQGAGRYEVPASAGLQKKYVWYDENGYLYNETNDAIGRITNFEDLQWPVDVETREETVDYGSDAIVVDGVTYHHIDNLDGVYPDEFMFYDDYGNFYDGGLNMVAGHGEFDTTPVTMVSPTPAPIPAVTTQTGTVNVKPKVADMPKEFTGEDYDKLYDACWVEYSIRGYMPEEMTVKDGYYAIRDRVESYGAQREQYLDNAIGLGIGSLILLALLLIAAGKRNEEGISVASGLGKLPWDLWIVFIGCLVGGCVLLVALAANLVVEGLYYSGLDSTSMHQLIELMIKGCTAVVGVCVAILVGTLHSLAARVKVKGWWRNCLCGKALVWLWKWCVRFVKWLWKLWLRIWGGCKGLVHGIPMIWKAVVVLAVVCIVEMVFCCMIYSAMAVVGILLSILKFLVCVIICLELKGLQQGARVIADGDLTHRIDTRKLHGELKEHAECLNRIGDGLSHSVDARLRSERMKTELITNVSHDLKTPLTSIVNYVDLLKKEELTGTAGEYVEVLDRQSARLKKLTEDLVEASKASSGALNVNVERVSLTELLEQAQAEYALRLGEIGLQSIVRQPDEEVTVWADGKYVWRILDNLLSNVRKYAMPNTRVYLELRKDGDMAVLSVKNMSRESLNISADELMERFVRGDSSRNTEGSGLGLSIAQSLAKLMGGELRITIDGDLFKADVLLPVGK